MAETDQKTRGFVLCVSGPSGSGKTSLCDRLAAEHEYVDRSISVTTRPQRPGELSGKDYIFVSHEDFERMKAAGEFLEWAEVFGNFYATPVGPVRESLNKAKIIVMDIDTIGASFVKKRMGTDSVTVFILPPSMQELERRLRERRQNTEKDLEMRLEEAAREIAMAPSYEYRIENGEFSSAYQQLLDIVEKERLKL